MQCEFLGLLRTHGLDTPCKDIDPTHQITPYFFICGTTVQLRKTNILFWVMVLSSNQAQPVDGAVQPAIWNII